MTAPLLGQQLVGEPEDPLQLVLLAPEHQDRDVDAVETPRDLIGIGHASASAFGAPDLEVLDVAEPVRGLDGRLPVEPELPEPK